MTLSITAIVTSAVVTIHANSIDARSKALNLLISVVRLVPVLCTVGNRAATSEGSAAPASGGISIVETRIDNLCRHVGRILYRCLRLAPLYECCVEVFLGLLQLFQRGILIEVDSLVGCRVGIAFGLIFLNGGAQGFSCVVDGDGGSKGIVLSRCDESPVDAVTISHCEVRHADVAATVGVPSHVLTLAISGMRHLVAISIGSGCPARVAVVLAGSIKAEGGSVVLNTPAIVGLIVMVNEHLVLVVEEHEFPRIL